MTRKFFLSLFAVMLVSGCSTYSLEELRQTTPQGTAFQNALAKFYMEFADGEEKAYDWRDSWYFADKGLLAAYGKDTVPEDLANWEISGEAREQLEKARADLLAALTPSAISSKPEIAARAQTQFDCWVEQQEEGWQPEEIDACRDGFAEALTELGISPKITKKYTKSYAKISRSKVAKKSSSGVTASTTSYVVFFDAGKAELKSDADTVVNEVVKLLNGKDSYEVVIADKSKNRKTNAALSAERAKIIEERLVEYGVKEHAIRASGEQSSVTKPVNQKVEIFLND